MKKHDYRHWRGVLLTAVVAMVVLVMLALNGAYRGQNGAKSVGESSAAHQLTSEAARLQSRRIRDREHLNGASVPEAQPAGELEQIRQWQRHAAPIKKAGQ